MSRKKYGFAPYDGVINHKTMSPEAVRALHVFTGQRQRCYNRKSSRWEWYGARGIEVEYTAREFIGWYLHHLALHPEIAKPSCGRIDHSKNYRLDNIEFVSRSANSSERNARHGSPRHSQRGVTVIIVREKLRLYFDSIGECARIVGIRRELLVQHLARKIPSPIPQLVFKYT